MAEGDCFKADLKTGSFVLRKTPSRGAPNLAACAILL